MSKYLELFRISKYLEKFSRFARVIKENGGLKASYLQFFRTDELKTGTLVGEDKYGNKYYENKMYFMGRSRWIDYPPSVGFDYDGSQIPAEWHGWLHYVHDDPPTVKKPVKRKWMMDHIENTSGTPQQYVPYSTVPPKIHSWKPHSS
ncbi:probable NADH dehydrogenase [ubiquinone] 1 alpha subcomplex subunit 12 [Gigantopelta aegis]|uniref:probable NADH dehydrogenase [ubiquinone] 1 alpha subcomplex subunit 12 n=1 Tax=Gigantopelta aegis TaxID=1735272 RepID=UPI001B88E5CF|nr:probable NADH dehydrogenase [ubiquinone] 1 alpha subcomplex subunit 12 [Gigantopelta aegis]